MKIDDAKYMIMDFLCRDFDENGRDSLVSEKDILDHLKFNSVSRGVYEVAMEDIFNFEYIIGNSAEGFHVTTSYFSTWTEETNIDDDQWKPLVIDDHENIANNIDEIAEKLGAENGYVAKHPIEAEHTIEISQGFSKFLRENDGKTIKKFLRYFIFLLERLSVIFEEDTRIGTIVRDLNSLLQQLLS